MIRAALSILALLAATWPSAGHEFYTGLRGRDSQLCCGGSDCAPTVFREKGSRYEFLTRENEWVTIPEDQITFLPIPGDDSEPIANRAHLCYRAATDYDRLGPVAARVFGSIFLYCAFINPGSI